MYIWTDLFLFGSTVAKIKELQNALVDVNEDAAHCEPLHPLYQDSGISADQLYSEVCIQRKDNSKPGGRIETVKNHADIFTKNNKPVGRVFMLGRPGHGKTTFCLHLLTLWCAAITSVPYNALSFCKCCKKILSVWEFGENSFHFVFYVSLRHVNRCRSSIADMICDMFVRYDDMKDVISHVLRSTKYRCLIIVDGLDEWVISPEVQDRTR